MYMYCNFDNLEKMWELNVVLHLWNEAALNTIEFIPPSFSFFPSSLEYMFSSNSMQVVIYSKTFEEKKSDR